MGDEGHCVDRLSEFLDGELAIEERRAVAEHLEQCAACRAELEVLRRVVGALGALAARRAPAGFAGRVKDRLAARSARPALTVLSAFWTRALLIAAMLLIVLGLVFTVQKNGLLERRPLAEPMALDLRRVPERAEQAVEAAVGDMDEPAVKRRAVGEPAPTAAEQRAPAHLKAMGAGAPSPELPAALAYRVPGRDAWQEEAEGEAGAILFTQAAGPPAPDAREPVQQVLTLCGEDPVALARRAVAAANAQGLGAALSLGAGERETAMELYLSVPVAQYEALLRSLARLAPADRNMLSNTGHARGEFFRRAVALYRGRQVAMELGEEAAEAAPADRPARVNLLIQVQRGPAGD